MVNLEKTLGLKQMAETCECVHAKSFQLCPTLATLWMVACQAPLSMGFSKKEYWSELPFPSSGDLPNPGIEAGSPALQAGRYLTN